MKYLLSSFLFLAVLTCTGITNAQTPNECANTFWGSSTPYSYVHVVYTPTPSEYVPVFINYIGAAGASHLHKDVTTTYTYALFQKADSAHAIKPDGIALRKMLMLIQNIEKPNLDKLTHSGIDELHDIGARMISSNGNVFLRPCQKISLINEDKMIKSAEALFAGLDRKIDAPECDKIDYKDDDNLRPQTVSKALNDYIEKGDWKDEGESVLDAKRPKNFTDRFLNRFFEKTFLEDVDEDLKNKFIVDMYNISLVTGSITSEISKAGYTWDEVNLRSYFSCNELEMFSMMSAAEAYYKSGPGDDKQGIQVKSSVPLLLNFINTTDAYSLNKAVAADIRITTPEVIASFAALMNLNDVNKASADVTKFDRNWKVEEVIPTSGNIQWILYQGISADTRTTYLVKFLLNEKEIGIDGLKAYKFPYYKWDDVKEYYQKKMTEDWDVEKLNDNMHTYLLNLKN